MQRALQTRRQRLRRLRELRSGTAGKATAGVLVMVILFGAVLAGAAGAIAFVSYNGYANDLPAEPRTAFAKAVLGPARIYDRHGTLLYEFEDENVGLRNPVALRDISPWVIKATIATEDNDFYDNPGVNVRGLTRAGVENFTDFEAGFLQGSGGSSITQQLVKNVFIPQEQRYERSADRKVKEAVLALELTRRYDKEQILEWYLNQIQYGNRTNGIEAAAERYFGKNAKDLSLAEAALLSGLPQAPARYDPYRYPDAAISRQHEVLDLMVRHGHITEGEASAAKAEVLQYKLEYKPLKSPHWVFYVRDQLIAQFGEETFKTAGLRVTTTLDLPLQERAEQILKSKITQFENPPHNCQCHNGSIVAIDNRNGEILAMVGSKDYWDVGIEGENNNALAIKQPGSALKPFVYLAAFVKGWNPGTIIYDQPTKFFWEFERGQRKYFIPTGPNRYWHGAISARNALGNSVNTTAVKAAGYVGISNFVEQVQKMGIRTMDDPSGYGVSIATGGSNITLLDLTYAYSVLANNGEMRGTPALGPKFGVTPGANHRKLDPIAFLKVEDDNGQVHYAADEARRGEQVVPSGYAYQVTDILQDNEAKRLTYGNPEPQFGMPDKRPVAAKTGTQQGPKDTSQVLSTWNFGYTPDLSVGVWVGNQDNKLVNPNLSSASSSLLIWREFMIEANKMLNLPPKTFPVPNDVKFYSINGKREPVVNGQKLIFAEDLKLWTQDREAGNAAAPTNGGAFISPEPRSTDGCREGRERTAAGQEQVTYFCAGPGSLPFQSGPAQPQTVNPAPFVPQNAVPVAPRPAAPFVPQATTAPDTDPRPAPAVRPPVFLPPVVAPPVATVPPQTAPGAAPPITAPQPPVTSPTGTNQPPAAPRPFAPAAPRPAAPPDDDD